ncbi:MAG TPA: queuosine salvage family protein, partial [Candidatus Xenobia bacterium]
MESVTDPGILPAAEKVIAEASHVRIVDAEIETHARGWTKDGFSVPTWNRDLHYHDGTERTVNYVLVLDALNFSFWPNPG